MCLPEARVAYENEVFRATHVPSQSQLQDGGFGDILHCRKIVLSDLLDERELRAPDGRLDPLGISIRHLCFTQAQQKLFRREAIACGIARIGLIRLKECGESQCSQLSYK